MGNEDGPERDARQTATGRFAGVTLQCTVHAPMRSGGSTPDAREPGFATNRNRDYA